MFWVFANRFGLASASRRKSLSQIAGSVRPASARLVSIQKKSKSRIFPFSSLRCDSPDRSQIQVQIFFYGLFFSFWRKKSQKALNQCEAAKFEPPAAVWGGCGIPMRCITFHRKWKKREIWSKFFVCFIAKANFSKFFDFFANFSKFFREKSIRRFFFFECAAIVAIDGCGPRPRRWCDQRLDEFFALVDFFKIRRIFVFFSFSAISFWFFRVFSSRSRWFFYRFRCVFLTGPIFVRSFRHDWYGKRFTASSFSKIL